MDLFWQYLNALTSGYMINRFLCEVISIIGKKYIKRKGRGSGSHLAKGMQYLKSQIVGCTTKHIKKMLTSEPTWNKEDAEFVFRFSTNSYVKLFAKIVEIMDSNFVSFSDDIKDEILSIKTTVPVPKYTYSELLIRVPLISLITVCLYGKPEKSRTAQTIQKGIESADKKYKI
jgi:hypothetical protein